MRSALFMMIDTMCGLVFAIPIIWIIDRFVWKKKTGYTIWSFVLMIYLIKMFDVVGVPSIEYLRWNPEVNLRPLVDFGDSSFAFQMGANAIMFLPLGFMLAYIWGSNRSVGRTVVNGAILSLVIELIQLFSFRLTDIDDFLMNTLGSVIGYLVFAVMNKIFWKKKKSRRTVVWDQTEFWVTVIVALIVIIFLRRYSSHMIYSLFE